jgi:hypothetical protein
VSTEDKNLLFLKKKQKDFFQFRLVAMPAQSRSLTDKSFGSSCVLG